MPNRLSFVRTSLDEAEPAASPRPPRRIRTTLEEEQVAAPQLAEAPAAVTPPSHASFPAPDKAPPAPVGGRVIRVSLDDGASAFARLHRAARPARRLRLSLD